MPLPGPLTLPSPSLLPGIGGGGPSYGTPTAYGVTLTTPPAPISSDGVFVEVAWDDGTGLFTIGTSLIGGTDVLSGIFPLEDWIDLTVETQQVQISRGRQDATSPIQQSTCTVMLVDESGKYNSANPSSPLYGKLAASRPMRVFARYKNTDYPLWTGVTSEVTAAASKADPYASLAGVDLLERLSQEEIIIPGSVDTTTGEAISMILDAVGWWGDRRVTTTGDALVGFGTDQSEKALDLIGEVLDHEGGIFYIDAAGNTVYQPYQGTNIVSATVASPNLITPGVSISTIYNRAQVTASQGAEQTYIDGASLGKHGPRDVPGSPVDAQWLPDEAAALILAERLVTTNETSPIWQLTLQKADLSDPTAEAVYLNMLSLDLGSRITLDDPDSGTQGDYSIQGITHTIQSGGLDHETTWVLRMMPVHVFTIGQSVLDGTDTLGA